MEDQSKSAEERAEVSVANVRVNGRCILNDDAGFTESLKLIGSSATYIYVCVFLTVPMSGKVRLRSPPSATSSHRGAAK